jgi:MFS family permease
MRGRVMGVYGLLSRGGPGTGALIMGALSAHFGLQIPVAGGAVVCLFFWVWMYRRRARMRKALEDGSPA